jgi:hypothetical protein
VPLRVFTSIESDCSEQGYMTVMTTILNSVHTFNDKLQIRSVQLSMFTSIVSDCSEQGDMTELNPIM